MQSDVDSIRYRIERGEKRLIELRAEINKIDADPEAYRKQRNERYAFDSYVIQASVLNIRCKIEYYIYSFPAKYISLFEEEAKLTLCQQEVLDEVRRMKPSSGRVPWPDDLPPLSQTFRNRATEWTRQTPETTAFHAQREKEFEKHLDRLREEWQAQRQHGPVIIELDLGTSLQGKGPPELWQPLRVLGLSWPICMETLRTHYLDLAREHHPDATGGNVPLEEALKYINVAYATVRQYLSSAHP